MADPFRSERLIYRAVDKDEDFPLFLKIYQDPIGYQNANFRIAKPQGRAGAEKHMTYMSDEALIGVIIYLPATDAQSKPVPIGLIHLEGLGVGFTHHRHSEIGIDIVKEYQGKGYGSEAIKFILGWGFETAGLHRISIKAFEYNDGARRLYERLGFKLEGRSREFVWAHNRWWDDIQFGMLEWEWAEMSKQSVSK